MGLKDNHNIHPGTHPNVFAWFSLCMKFSDTQRGTWAAAAAGGKGGKGGKQEGGKGGKQEGGKKGKKGK